MDSNSTTLLVYGGSTGLIRTISTPGNDGALIALNKDCLPRRWDDDEDIRAVAISNPHLDANESRIALGFDSGCTLFLLYDNLDAEAKQHPFVHVSEQEPNGRKCRTESGPSFAAPVRDMQFHPQSSDWVVVATEEGVCMLRFQFSTDDATYAMYFQEEATKAHDGSGVRCVCFSPNGDIVASLGMDGRLCLWYVSLTASSSEDLKPHRNWTLIHRDSTRCITKRDTGEILGADPFDRSCRPYFISDTLLVLPGETYLQFRHIRTQITDGKPSWFVTEQIETTKGHVESIVTFTSVDLVQDPNRKILVATGRDKRITVWDIDLKTSSKVKLFHLLLLPMIHSKQRSDSFHAKSRSVQENPKVRVNFIRQFAEVESAPTDVLWMSDEQRLLVACAQGTLVLFPGANMIPSTLTVNDVPAPSKAMLMNEDTPKNAATFFDDSDDENLFGGTSPDDGNAKDIPVKSNKNPFVDDEAEDDADESISKKSQPADQLKKKEGINGDIASYDSDNDDIDGAYPAMYDAQMINDANHRQFASMDLPEKQPPFAPSSSPLDLPRRYLCWNSIGSVTLRHSDGDDITNFRNTVDIHFTDSGVRRPISFTDNLGFILGSLGEDGGIFATDLVEDDDDDDDDLLDEVGVAGLSETTRQAVKKSRRNQKDSTKPTGSTIYFHRFETFAALREKDWYLTLPNGERVLGCATGEGWAAVMTSRRFLRLFSSGGNQGQIMWLDGQPITMVGRFRFLAVFYHQGEPFRDGTQAIGYKLIDAMTNCVLASGPTTCISNSGTLSWAGFSNDGSLLVMDSEGMVSMLVKSNSSVSVENNGEWVWMPVLDTLGLRKSSDDSFWPVTVYDGKLICIPLKGKVKYPDATRRPVTANLSLKIPLARSPIASV